MELEDRPAQAGDSDPGGEKHSSSGELLSRPPGKEPAESP